MEGECEPAEGKRWTRRREGETGRCLDGRSRFHVDWEEKAADGELGDDEETSRGREKRSKYILPMSVPSISV